MRRATNLLRAKTPASGFTLMEILLAMALFTILGLAVVTLLGQGMAIFESSTADTSMQDRLQAVLPAIRSDFAGIQPAEALGVPPPPVPDPLRATPGTPPAAAPQPPPVRLRSGWLKMADMASEVAQPCYYVAFVRTNALETEDPSTRDAGSVGTQGAGQLQSYEPQTAESGVSGNMLATGGLLEIAYVAIPDDDAYPGMLTLYRMFRAPIGGEKSLLNPANFDSRPKVHVAGRPVAHGVIHFGATFRNVFAKSWDDGLGSLRVTDGQPYVGAVWDSTRAIDKTFALFTDPSSLADVADDVFPALVRIELTLAEPGTHGFGIGETQLLSSITSDEINVSLESVTPLLKPGPDPRWLKVGQEWMSTTWGGVDSGTRRAVVARGARGTPAKDHKAEEPVYVGSQVATDVPLVYKDRYARSRR